MSGRWVLEEDVPVKGRFVLEDDTPAAVKAGKAANSIPRQLGLTARYGLEGVANAAQLFTEPLRAVTDMLAPGRSAPLGTLATQFADKIGLPSPDGANERVVAEASKFLAGTGGMGAASRGAAQLPGLVGKAGEFLGANMGTQLAAAGGAGLAGGASKEAGGSPLEQGVAAFLGSAAAGSVPGLASAAVDRGRQALNRLTPQQMDTQISALLERSGQDYSQVPERARQALRAELQGALRAGRELDPAAVARLADFNVIGATPTRGMVSRDPAQFTREANLAKMGANSADESLQTLARVQSDNNQTFIRTLNDAGANRGDTFRAGQAAVGAINAQDEAMQRNVSGLYTQARSMPGGNTPLDRKSLVDNIYGELARENKLAFLPESVSNMIDTISAGVVKRGGRDFDVPFDAKALDNLLTTIATAQRGTMDGNTKAALTIARRAIDSTPIQPVKNAFGGNQVVTKEGANFLRGQDAQAGEFMGALNQARQAAAQRFGWRESAQPIEAAIEGAQPDKFLQKFVIGGSLADARAVAQNAPRDEVKNAILAHLKEKALNKASDEVGAFSQASYNKALLDLDRKLPLFFDPAEIAQLRALGRVASYAQSQPVGSAVNNSNTGGMVLGRGLDALTALARRVPGGEAFIASPLRNIQVSVQGRQAQNVLPSLLAPQDIRPLGSSLLLPGLAVGGSLAGSGQ